MEKHIPSDGDLPPIECGKTSIDVLVKTTDNTYYVAWYNYESCIWYTDAAGYCVDLIEAWWYLPE